LIHEWVYELNLPRGGRIILYTGLLYQLTPYIEKFVEYLEKLEMQKLPMLKVAKYISKIVDISKFLEKQVSKEELERQKRVLKSIAHLLSKAGVKFGYLYEEEPYSGALLYDLGLEELFIEHASKVAELFRKHGVETLITIDPHTTYILRKIYPLYIEGFNLEVKNYLEILDNSELIVKKKINKKLTIHDPCLYSRYEKITEEPRRLLKRAGYEIIEVKRNRELTYCCGGPIESISPKLSGEIAKKRLSELKGASREIVVLCPICYSNLKRASDSDVIIQDISLYLCDSYCD